MRDRVRGSNGSTTARVDLGREWNKALRARVSKNNGRHFDLYERKANTQMRFGVLVA